MLRGISSYETVEKHALSSERARTLEIGGVNVCRVLASTKHAFSGRHRVFDGFRAMHSAIRHETRQASSTGCALFWTGESKLAPNIITDET